MHIDLPLLKSFVAIADHGNFLAASQVVARSPAAISMQVKKLEELLGQTLFTRDARQTSLTRDGERLLPYARKMLLLESEIKSEFEDTPLVGGVSLGVPDDVVERFPMTVLARFTNEYPNIKLSIHVDQTPSLLRRVDKRELDLSIITYAPTIPGVSECERISREPEVWAQAANGIAAEKTPLPITLWDKGWVWHEPTIKGLVDAGIDYNIVLECENVTGRKSAIDADLAVGPLPASLIDENLKVVSALQARSPLPEYGLGLKVNSSATPETRTLTDYIRRHFKESELMSDWKKTRKLKV